MPIPDKADVCIIGGGPAGLSGSIALAQKGLGVVVLDCATPPVDKACGEGLMPDSVDVLARLGITLPDDLGYPFRGIRFSNETCSAVAEFPAGRGLGVRRTVLHNLLRQRAEELGVKLCWGVKHVQLADGGVSCNGKKIACRLTVGADGQNSRIRQEAGLDEAVFGRRRYGFRRHYRIAPWSPYMELHWGENCQVYVTPVSSQEVSVTVISRDSALRLDDVLPAIPHLHSRLQEALPPTGQRGALTVSRVLRRVANGRVALLGDASGSVDAITGEGLCLSFKQSLALADAFDAHNLNAYRSAHRSLSRLPHAMASVLLILDRFPSLQRRSLVTLERHPEFFSSLLSVHIGQCPVRDLCSWRLLPLCCDFVAA